MVVLVSSMVMLFSPASEVPKDYPLNDKFIHALIFFTLGITALGARLGRWAFTIVVLAGYAATSEVLQEVLPIGRDGNWGDLVADFLGLALALGLARVLASRIGINRAQG